MFRQMFEEKYMRFPDGKTKAVALSYDDGVKADIKLVSVLDRYGLKGTFNLNTKLFDCENWHGRMNEELTYNTFAHGGHEVALHGARHIFLHRVPLPEAVNEIVQNRVYLENMFGRIVNGLAYPYNSYNDDIVDVMRMCGVKYARTTDSTRSFDLPADWLRLNPTCHHNDPMFSELCDKFFSADPDKEFKNRECRLFFIWGHSYEFDDRGNWNVIENFAERAAAQNNVWFATCGEIYEYVTAYENLIFSMDGERVKNPSAQPVWIDLRGKTYKIDGGATLQFDKEI